MADKPIKLKINVTRILKQHLYEGKNGKYLDLVAWPNRNGVDQYGNTHFVAQEVSRQAREAGEKGPIVGKLSLPVNNPLRQQAPPKGRQTAGNEPEPTEWTGPEDEDIPF